MERIEKTVDGYWSLYQESLHCLVNRNDPYGVFNAVASAETNANDTMRETHNSDCPLDSEAAHEKWNDFFWSSLESITTYPEMPKATRAWFGRRGIQG